MEKRFYRFKGQFYKTLTVEEKQMEKMGTIDAEEMFSEEPVWIDLFSVTTFNGVDFDKTITNVECNGSRALLLKITPDEFADIMYGEVASITIHQ